MTIFFGKANTKAKRLKNPASNHTTSTLHPPVSSQALVCTSSPSVSAYPPYIAYPSPSPVPGRTNIQPPPPSLPPPPPPGPVASQPSYSSHYPLYAEGRWQGGLGAQWPSAGPAPLSAAIPGINTGALCTEYLNRGAALCDLLSTKLDSVITSIDGERFSGDERELVVYQNPALRGGGEAEMTREISRGANNVVSTAIISTNYFSKANLYANSRLPPNLPPLRLYFSTYPLLCLAAQYAERVYARPSGAERDTQVDADWRLGTKAMMIKSVPLDQMNTIVFAIRGSQTFMDWAVNLNSAPTSPDDFLDDPGNLCHSGFLSVARKMIKPVAARLRTLLEEDPSRTGCSLLITGHSAGGAVASLLYSHMLSTTVESELNILTGCFKRIHCITFGTPPISLLPLEKPADHRFRKFLFLSFINEGDPVPRADKAYIRSLINLYSTPSPIPNTTTICPLQPATRKPKPRPSNNQLITTTTTTSNLTPWKRPKPAKTTTPRSTPIPIPIPAAAAVWKVPAATLSNAGRLVLLRTGASAQLQQQQQQRRRSGNGSGGRATGGRAAEEDVSACVTSDQQLRGVVFGDPLMHVMRLYARRIEILATDAVLARGFGGHG
ncbi:MAG: hypothetical protein M1816_002746 [Peltula sp. TS41687]|nr:MAG: hypothetical protein M1816_002746 [Peltula sp. TS41687]